MDEEEAAALLSKFQGMLREMELDWLVPTDHCDEESDGVAIRRSARDQLRELVQYLHSVIVVPPKMLAATMESLEACSLAFSSDLEEQDEKVAERDRVVIDSEIIAALTEASDRVRGIFAQLEERLGE